MSLYKRGRIWWINTTHNGQRYLQSTGTQNRRKAESIERQFREELNDMRHRLPQQNLELTLGELSTKFIAAGMARPHSLDRLNHLLPFFADLPVREIRTATIRQYRQERHAQKTLKVSTVNRDLSVLRRVLNWGVEEGLIAANPLGKLRLERERRTKRAVLSLREERLLLAAAPLHLRRFILCALHTGMRRGEILAERWEDIDLDNRILYVTHSKTPEGEAREIPLTDALYQMLHAIRRDHGPVFTFEGDPLKNIKTSWAASVQRAGIRHFRFHDLRHTANTRMMLAGVLQEIRREIIGHTSQRSRDVNDRYTQIELPEKLSAIRKLETWLGEQARLLEAEAQRPLLLPPPTETTNPHTEDSNDGTSHSIPAA